MAAASHSVDLEGAHPVEPEGEEDAGHHAHHDRQRDGLHGALHPAGGAERDHQQAGDDVSADHLAERSMWASAGPISTVPGMVQKNTSGWR